MSKSETNHKMLFIPYDENDLPRIVPNRKEFGACFELNTHVDGYSISSELTLLCQTHYKGRPNPHLVRFGVVYPGACLIIREVYDDEGEGGYVNVPDDLYDQLGIIFEADRRQRENYIINLASKGVNIIEL